MKRILVVLPLALVAIAPSVVPATAQSGNRAEAERRLAFVRSVTGDRSWTCSMVTIGGSGVPDDVDMTVSLLPNGNASVTTTTRATLNGRSYSASYRLIGRGLAFPDGSAVFDLGQSRLVRADTLPPGSSWSDSASVRIALGVVPDTVSGGRYPYMLQGMQTDNSGRAAVTCMVQTR